MLITQFIPKHKLSKLETTHCVERTVPVLLARTGDSSARLRAAASNFIQVRRAQSPLLGALPPPDGPPGFPGSEGLCCLGHERPFVDGKATAFLVFLYSNTRCSLLK